MLYAFPTASWERGTSEIIMLPIIALIGPLTLGLIIRLEDFSLFIFIFIFMIPILSIAVTNNNKMHNIFYRLYYLFVGTIGSFPLAAHILGSLH